MHQLGPPQRVPSLVEARRALLTKSDTLFARPYVCVSACGWVGVGVGMSLALYATVRATASSYSFA